MKPRETNRVIKHDFLFKLSVVPDTKVTPEASFADYTSSAQARSTKFTPQTLIFVFNLKKMNSEVYDQRQ